MTSFLTSLYLLSFKQLAIHTLDVDCIMYQGKNVSCNELYNNLKNEYLLTRCSKCKQTWQLKKNMKCVEKLFKSHKCFILSFEPMQPLTIFFSNGAIVSIKLINEKNTLEKIDIDNTLCGRITSSKISDIIFDGASLFIAYSEPKLTYVYYNQHSQSFSAKLFGRTKGKVVGFDPKVTNIDLVGPSSRNIDRKMSLNSDKDLLLIWWHFASCDVWPWTPVTHLTDMIIYRSTLTKNSIEVLCTLKVQGELVHASFSKCHSHKIITLEEIKNGTEICTNICIYELLKGQCHRVYLCKLPLQGNLVAFDWTTNEDKLLASNNQKMLLMHDVKKKLSTIITLSFLPKQIVWHPQNCIAIIVGTSSQVQCFDAALTHIKFKVCDQTIECDTLEMNKYFFQQCNIENVAWEEPSGNSCILMLGEIHSFIFLKFSSGSALKHFTPVVLISHYLNSDCIDESLLLLNSLNWCTDSQLCFQCLSKIVNFLFRKPLNFRTLAALELALGSFYKSVEVMPKTIFRFYQQKITHLSRRFFHHLLRYHQFQKAFLLAVDLDSQDLFFDLCHVARQKGENVLALVAFHKAEELASSQDSSSAESVSDNTSESFKSEQEDVNFDFTHLSDSKRFAKSTAETLCSDFQNWLQVNKSGKTSLQHHRCNSTSHAKCFHVNTSPSSYFFRSELKRSSSSTNCSVYALSSRKTDMYECEMMQNLLPTNVNLSSTIISDPNLRYVTHNSRSQDNRSEEYQENEPLDEDIEESEDIEDNKIKLVHFGII